MLEPAEVYSAGMGDLDELASARRSYRTAAPMRPGNWSPGEAFSFGFFAGLGIWFAFVLCTFLAWRILHLAGQMNHRAVDPSFGVVPTAHNVTRPSPSA